MRCGSRILRRPGSMKARGNGTFPPWNAASVCDGSWDNQLRFTKKRIAAAITATTTAISTIFANVMLPPQEANLLLKSGEVVKMARYFASLEVGKGASRRAFVGFG
jgi:hypothetical protein